MDSNDDNSTKDQTLHILYYYYKQKFFCYIGGISQLSLWQSRQRYFILALREPYDWRHS